jgi:hypothetical protein
MAKEFGRDAALGLGASDDLVVEAVVQPRHRHEHCRAQRLQILEQLERVALVESDRRARVEAKVDDHRLEDVGERQVGDVDVLYAGAVGGEDRPLVVRRVRDRRQDVLVREHRALGVARRAARVAQQREVFGRRRGQRRQQRGVGLAERLELRVEQQLEAPACLGLLQPLLGHEARHDDRLERALFAERRQLGRRAQHRRGGGLALDVVDGLGAEGVVHGHDDHAGLVARQRRHAPVAAVLQEEAEEAPAVRRHWHEVFLPDAAGDVVNARANLLVGLPLVCRHLAVRAHARSEARRCRPQRDAVQEAVVKVAAPAIGSGIEQGVGRLGVAHDRSLALGPDGHREAPVESERRRRDEVSGPRH